MSLFLKPVLSQMLYTFFFLQLDPVFHSELKGTNKQINMKILLETFFLCLLIRSKPEGRVPESPPQHLS